VPEWAHELGATTWAQFFLKFLLGYKAVTAVIPGTTNPTHLAEQRQRGSRAVPGREAAQSYD
jgi:aryl-alcohol dehydrogenase-like predicted oxidoreductase